MNRCDALLTGLICGLLGGLLGCDDGGSTPPIVIDAGTDAQTPDGALPDGALPDSAVPDMMPDAAIDMAPPDEDADRVARIEALFQPWIEAGFAPSASVALVTPDAVRFLQLGEGLAAGLDTVYEIGSLSKVFTGLLLAEMVAAGQVTVQTPVGELLPAELALPEATTAIPLQALTTHLSGLPRLANNMPFGDVTDPYADYPVELLYAFLEGFTPPADPAFEYSNLGVGLLGHALGRAADAESWEAALAARVLTPLGMLSTATDLDAAQWITGHDADGRPTAPWHFTDATAAAGALRSTVRDMARFAQAQINPPEALAEAITASHQALTMLQPDLSIGYGWFDVGAFQATYHNGGTGGFASFLAFDTDAERAVVVLYNAAMSASLADGLGWRALQLWRGEDPEIPTPPEEATLTDEQLDLLVGTYSAFGTDLVVSRVDDRLFVRLGDQPAYGIYPLSTVRFYLRVVDAQLSFSVLAGVVTAVTLEQDGRQTRFDRQN